VVWILPYSGAQETHTTTGSKGAKLPGQELAFGAVVGRSEAIQEAIALAYRVARSPIRMVLLDGETGTGKELFARGIHNAGTTSNEPFAAINCAAIPASLLESELFGHERGAFTGAASRKQGLMELARTGTVLLDEIGELSLGLQAKLLRVLEDRTARRVGGVQEIPIKCRVVAATNESLDRAVARGAFREDLFYRLNAFRITLPPLRSRGNDLELVIRHFLKELAADQFHFQEAKSVSPEAFSVLRSHEWRGNIRELKNVIERAAVVCDGSTIEPQHIVLHKRTALTGEDRPSDVAGEIVIPRGGLTMDQIEREAIRVTLMSVDGNQSRAARMLGIGRATLIRKLHKFGLGAGPDVGLAGVA
jgi:transcriptional regulator with PAS, ATPase and Fis domain